jgi:hypothetical protein
LMMCNTRTLYIPIWNNAACSAIHTVGLASSQRG